MKKITIICMQVLRTLCAVSLVLLSFAHQPVAFASQSDMSLVEQAAYVLPDGTGLAFCLSGKNEEEGVVRPCEFCRIAGSVVLPMRSGTVLPECLPVSVTFVVQINKHMAVAGFPPAAPPRGPPTIRI